MSEKNIIKGIVFTENMTYSFVEVCERYQLPEDVLMDWMAHGLFGEEYSSSFEAVKFDQHMIDRIRTAHRLHHDLEVNLQGVVLVMELLDKMADMQEELAIIKRMTS